MDYYHLLLSIPPGTRPPTHYQLLGLVDFESNHEVIENAYRRQCQYLRSLKLRFPNETTQLLNELSAAKVCLVDTQRRKDYERDVRKLHAESKGSISSGSEESVARHARMEGLDSSLNDESLSAPSWVLPKVEVESSQLLGEAKWVVGSGSECEIRIRAPWVSRRHCQIRVSGKRAYVEDLQSTNGTFVDGLPVQKEIRLLEDATITLGRKTRLVWPFPANFYGANLEVYSIGRSPDCDYVIDDKSVSSLHAQMIIEQDRVSLEDLKSTNGTRVGRLSNRVERCEIEPHLSLFFGAKKVFAKTLIDAVRQKRQND